MIREVRLYMQERRKGSPQRLAAARAGMSERTARKYEKRRQLPSQLKRPHDWNTRENPFEEDWPWVISQLERDPALQGSTLFALLCERHPERYRAAICDSSVCASASRSLEAQERVCESGASSECRTITT